MYLLELKSTVTGAGRKLVDVVVTWAVMMTNTGINKHHWFPDDLAFRTLELHLSCLSAVRGAAPAISAQPTKTGLVGLDACAILEGEVGFSVSSCS